MQRPTDRLKRKVEKENLWIFILSSLRKGKKCGKEIKNSVEEKFGFLTGNVTAYKVLYLLDSEGYVKSEKTGKMVYYEITKKGEREFSEGMKYLKRMSSIL